MIDAHVHLWRIGANDCVWPTPADGVLHRDFGIDEMIAVLDGAAVDRAVLIQSQESPRDTAWLLDLAATSAATPIHPPAKTETRHSSMSVSPNTSMSRAPDTRVINAEPTKRPIMNSASDAVSSHAAWRTPNPGNAAVV